MVFARENLFLLVLPLCFLFLTLRCDRKHILINEERICIDFNPYSMTRQCVVNQLYQETIRFSGCSSSEPVEILLLDDADGGMQLTDSIFSWTPRLADTGLTTVQCELRVNGRVKDTISWNILVIYWPENCAPYTHKDDATVLDASSLPAGYFIYSSYAENGIFRSEIQHFEPHLIPNTRADLPGNLSISDDGNWICYVDKSRSRICLLTINGCKKTIVPVIDTDSGYPAMAGFYRNSPYGTEIFYLASSRILRSVKVNLSGDNPVFSNDRILADLQDSYCFRNADFMQMSVVKDQIFAEINPIVDTLIFYRTGYLTIPDQGRGVGGPPDVYKWKDDIQVIIEGCGHTQSHDGLLSLSNPGGIGNPTCVPHRHKGFYITEFRRVTDPPINFFSEHVDRFGISINWCPSKYHDKSRADVDFWGWYFGNNNDYVVGRQMGYLNENGIWMVNWKNNSWYRLTPLERNILTLQPAVYFYNEGQVPITAEQCEEDTTEKPLPYDPAKDLFNPNYSIVYPNGGETFIVGQQCTVKVTANKNGNAMLNISYNNGLNWDLLPGLNRSINPVIDSLIIFTIPDSVVVSRGKRISTVSDKCWLQLIDYGNPKFMDLSDSSFSIKK